ncbi:MAG TPA: glycosyltransferase [Longimicrobiales bacterium]
MDPDISVIVPVYNEPRGLERTVASLLRQDGARSYEVIVVDNGSADSTPRVADRLAEEHAGRVVSAREPRIRSSYAARNEGIRRARGGIFCFVDADMWAPPDYLARVGAAFDRGEDYVGCRVEIVPQRPTLAAWYNRAVGFPVREYLERLHFAPTCCLSVRRGVFDAVGAFDARLESGGDLEFGQRVHAAGFRQFYAEEIVLRHPARASYRALLSKQRRIARGAAQLAHHYPERYGHLARRFRTARYYLPSRPRWLAARLRAAGYPATWLRAFWIACWAAPLAWIEPLVFVRETRRLRAGTAAGAVG